MIDIHISISAKNPQKITRFLAVGIVVTAGNTKREMAFPLYDSSNVLARLQSLRLALLSIADNKDKVINIYLSNDKYLKYLRKINNIYCHEHKKYSDTIKRVRELNEKLKPRFFVVAANKQEIVASRQLAKLCTASTKVIDRITCL